MTLLRRNRKWWVSGISSNHIERPHVALSCKVTHLRAVFWCHHEGISRQAAQRFSMVHGRAAPYKGLPLQQEESYASLSTLKHSRGANKNKRPQKTKSASQTAITKTGYKVQTVAAKVIT